MAVVLEFFCGIGGLANCLPNGSRSIGIDINQSALDVYHRNFNHPTYCKAIESLDEGQVRDIESDADLWWMSPPCQPHTSRGLQRDLDDARSEAFTNILRLINQIRPRQIGLENVAGFANSVSHERMHSLLDRCGYHCQTMELCPTMLGSINRRPRFYLLASLERLPPRRSTEWVAQEFDDMSFLPRLDQVAEMDSLRVDESLLGKYKNAMHIVSENDFLECNVKTRCFTSAYGRSPVRSGSYLEDRYGVRRFSPREIIWQLGFPSEYALPDWSNKRLWPLVGNSLALRSIRYLLAHLRFREISILS